MGWRTAHGDQRRRGRVVVSEVAPADELPAASPSLPEPPQRGSDGRFLPGNRIARQAKTRAGSRGILFAVEAKADPAWRAARRWARRAAGHRIDELAAMHGGSLSAGVCALVADEWEMRGDARYLAARASADGDADLSRAAAQLLASARQAGRDAWELASREAKARPPSPEDTPWLLPAGGDDR